MKRENNTHNKIRAQVAKWHEIVAAKNIDGLGELLADDVRFHSPFVWKPKAGKQAAFAILSTVADVFEDFAYHREFFAGDTCALEFSAHIGGLALKGVDLIRFDETGKITELEVMIRPANALQALGAEVGRRLAGGTIVMK